MKLRRTLSLLLVIGLFFSLFTGMVGAADAADAEALSAIVDAAQAVCTSYEKDCRIVR